MRSSMSSRIIREPARRMKLTYDPRDNIAYLRLEVPAAEVETVHVSDELSVDLTPDGKVYGIELLNANQQLQAIAPAS
jgi:uncharacterized protein YuzE